jgi:hypothetical protein
MLDGWEMTQHAIDRALDMAVEGDAIRTVLTDPEGTKPGRVEKYPDAELWWNGRVTLAVNPKQKKVITVLWNTGGHMDRTEDDELWWRD